MVLYLRITMFTLALGLIVLLPSVSAVCVSKDNSTEYCCMEIPFSDHSVACVNLTYARSTAQLTVILEVDQEVLLNKTFAAQNPPPLCVGVVYRDGLCIHFGRLNITGGFCGCVDVLSYVFGYQLFDVPLGCFMFGGCRVTAGVGCGVQCAIDGDCDPAQCQYCESAGCSQLSRRAKNVI